MTVGYGGEHDTSAARPDSPQWSTALWTFAVASSLVAMYLVLRGTELGHIRKLGWTLAALGTVLALTACCLALRRASGRWRVVAGLVAAVAFCAAGAVLLLGAQGPPRRMLSPLTPLAALACALLALVAVAYVVADRLGRRRGPRVAVSAAVALAVAAPLAVAVTAVPTVSHAVERANVVSSTTSTGVGVLRTRLAGQDWIRRLPLGTGSTQVVATRGGFGVALPSGAGVVDPASGRLRWTYRALDTSSDVFEDSDDVVASTDGRSIAVALTRHGVDRVTVLDAVSGRALANLAAPTFEDDGETHSETLYAVDGSAEYFSDGQRLTSVDRHGRTRWQVEETGTIAAVRPTAAGVLTILDADDPAQKHPALVMRDEGTGKARWGYGRASSASTPPVQLVVRSDTVVAQLQPDEPTPGSGESTRPSEMVSLRLSDGGIAWRRRISEPDSGPGVCPAQLGQVGDTLVSVTCHLSDWRATLTLQGLYQENGRQRWRTTVQAKSDDVGGNDVPRDWRVAYASRQLAVAPTGQLLLSYLSRKGHPELVVIHPGDGRVERTAGPASCAGSGRWPTLLRSGATVAVVCLPSTDELVVTGLR